MMRSGRYLAGILFGLGALLSFPAYADTRIAVLEFRLNDLTLLPGTPQELARTASIAPLLRAALSKKEGDVLVDIDPAMQAEIEKAVSGGHLLDQPLVAAELGRKAGADWMVIGRVHKPSFLFVYLMVQLVDVNSERLAGNYVLEVKGGYSKKLHEQGAARLAEMIAQSMKGGGDAVEGP
jgi:hypothetical protein